MPSTLPCPTILLVEDSEDDAFFFRRALRATGVVCELTHVQDGAEAIQHFEQVQAGARPTPDLVFLDLKLPIFNGFQILEWLREHPCAQLPLLAVLSGSEEAADVQRAHALGAGVFYVKPILPQQLKTRLQTWTARLEAARPVGEAITRHHV